MDINRLRKLAGTQVNEGPELQFEDAMDQLVNVLVRDINSGMLDIGPQSIEDIEHLLRSVAAEVAGPANPHRIDIQGQIGSDDYDDSMSPEDNVRQVFDRSNIGR